MFFGTDWVVTIQERADGDSFGAVRDSIRQRRGACARLAPTNLVYLLIDAVVDAYFPVLDALAERMQALEEEALVPTGRTEDTPAGPRPAPPRPHRRPPRGVADARGGRRSATRGVPRSSPPRRVSSCATSTTTPSRRWRFVESLRETAVSVMEMFLSTQTSGLNEVNEGPDRHLHDLHPAHVSSPRSTG